MRTLILQLLLFFSPGAYCQVTPYQVWTVEALLNIGKSKGIKQLESFTDPMNLLYADSTISNQVIDIEFRSGWLEKHPDSTGIYWYNIPENTKTMAEKFYNRSAAVRLFNYYKHLPKFIHSDTIYITYNNLKDILSILVYYNPAGLKETLKHDFYEWQKLAGKAPVKKYTDFKTRRSMSFMESIKLRKSDLYPDCNFICFQLAYALKILNEPWFDDKLLAQLRINQTYPYIDRYKFPNLMMPGFFRYREHQKIVKLTEPCQTIAKMVTDSKGFEKILFQAIDHCCDFKIEKIICGKNNTAYLETSQNNGGDGYRIILTGKSLIIENVWSLIE